MYRSSPMVLLEEVGVLCSFSYTSQEESVLLKLASEGAPPDVSTRLTVMLRFFSCGAQERQFRDPGERMGPS